MKSTANRDGNSQLNPVHKNIVHAETLKNENKFLDQNRTEHFQLNPNNDKPSQIDPRKLTKQQVDGDGNEIFGNHYTEDPVQEAFSNEKLDQTLKTITLVPRQQYDFPMTSNQEVGWFSNQLVNKNKKNNYLKFSQLQKQYQQKATKNHGVVQSEITQFVDVYFEMTQINPFKKQR